MLETRRATVADVDAMAAHVQAGFDSYTAFAPAGWVPRQVAQDRDWMLELMRDGGTWGLLALDARRPIGHIAFFPARERVSGERRHWTERPVLPGVAHLWQLFVLPEWWGRGAAAILHEAAVSEMRARGFERSRLYTPAHHARARNFYERRGWTAGTEDFDDGLQLVLTEYWLELNS